MNRFASALALALVLLAGCASTSPSTSPDDIDAEAVFPRIVERVPGETGVPWTWEYGR